MSFEIVALIILLAGFCGLTFIVLRKAPVLAELPDDVASDSSNSFGERLKEKVNGFSAEKVLQKTLSKARVLTLKTERKTSDWLETLRRKTQKQNSFGKDNYWQEVKGVVEVRQPRPSDGEKSRSEPNFHYPLKNATEQNLISKKKGKNRPG